MDHLFGCLKWRAIAGLAGICLCAAALAPPGISIRRITSDGVPKYGITLSADGSTVGWLEVVNDPKLSSEEIVVVKAAATGGMWSREVFRSSNGVLAGALKGPRYDPADTSYRLKQGAQKLLLSADGGRMVLHIDEFAKSRHYDYFLVLNPRAGEARLVPVAVPSGMGTYTGFTNYDSHGVWMANSSVGYALSEEGRFVLYSLKAFGAVNGNGKTLDALVAMDLDAGQALRIAGYQAMDAKGNITPGEPDYVEARVSTAGGHVAFFCGNAYWVGDFKGSPLRRVTAGENNIPQLAAGGRYVVEDNSGSFYPVAGGNKIGTAIPARGGLVFPFWDGEAGFLTHPHVGGGQEIGIVRASGASALIRAGAEGLPAGWAFGVKTLSSSFTYRLASADGRRVLLSMIGPDGKNDLFLAERPGGPVSGAPPPTTVSTAKVPAPAPPVSPSAVPGSAAITTGPAAVAASGTLGPDGGRIEITAQNHPIRGFSLSLPQGAYGEPRTFTVSTAPIAKHNLGTQVEIVTPLIRVENGGGFAEKPMTVTIPAETPDGFAIMGFYYDEAAGKLEGMPLVQAANNSVTLLAGHFSSFFLARVRDRVLPPIADSGFRPGVDDWQMRNEGSFVTPGGHCTGQSVTAMWYYFEKKLRNQPRLYGRYDNNGGPATPAFWQDDSLAVRLISTVWRDLQWGSDRRRASLQLGDMQADRAIFNAFRFSIHLTGEPQLAEIFRFDAKTKRWQGHAIVVFKAEQNKLLVADPNFPGQADRFIEFDPAAGRFKPYFSGETASSQGVNYTNICYVAKTALIPWAKLGERWKEFEQSFGLKPQENARLIGNGYYPPYNLYIVDSQGRTELADYHVTDREKLKVEVESAGNRVRVIPHAGGGKLSLNNDGEIVLQPGYNHIGFYVQGAAEGYWQWLDFPHFRIYRNTLAIDPGELKGKPGTAYSFSARNTAGGAPVDAAAFEWRFGDGTPPQTGPTTQHTFSRPGRYNIALRAMDRQGRPIGQLSAVATIQEDGAPPQKADAGSPADLSAMLRQFKAIEFILRADYVRSDGTRAEGYEFRVPPDYADWYTLPIQWQGNTFQGTFERLPAKDSPGAERLSATGAVRQSGADLFLDFEARMTYSHPGSANPPPYPATAVQELKVRNIPLAKSRASTPALVGPRLEGDRVRDLLSTLVVTTQSRGQSVSLQSIEWRGSSIKVELTSYIRKRE